MRQYKIRVFRDDEDGPQDYTISANSEVMARCLAFTLDGGLPAGTTDFDEGHRALAFVWTQVIA